MEDNKSDIRAEFRSNAKFLLACGAGGGANAAILSISLGAKAAAAYLGIPATVAAGLPIVAPVVGLVACTLGALGAYHGMKKWLWLTSLNNLRAPPVPFMKSPRRWSRQRSQYNWPFPISCCALPDVLKVA
jgi:hypothetical protein